MVMSIILVQENFARSSKSCDYVTFRVLEYLLSTSTSYTSLPHDLMKAKVLSLVNWCFNRDSETYLSTSGKAGFLTTQNRTRTNVGLSLVMWSFFFLRGKRLCAIWMHGISTISWGFLCVQTVLHSYRINFILLREGFCLAFTNLNGMTSYTCLTIPLDNPDISKQNFSWTKQIFLTKKLLS